MVGLQPGAILKGSQHSYRIERELGRGGFGVTYLAIREADRLQVALKQLHISRTEEYKSIELFKREIAVLRRLTHPRIPNYIDDLIHEGFVLVQEYIAGYELSRVVRGEFSVNGEQLILWLYQILEVLNYLHSLTPPVLHRDITPKNIIIKDDGVAYLVDFGTVRVGLPETMDSTTAGSFGYAPMEQFRSRAYQGSDLYSLAMTILAVATGREPVDMPFEGTRIDIHKCLRGIRLDARLSLLLEPMLEPDPEQRLSEAGRALKQLRPLLEVAPVPAEGLATTSVGHHVGGVDDSILEMWPPCLWM